MGATPAETLKVSGCPASVWCNRNIIKQLAGTDHRDVLTLLCQSMAGSQKDGGGEELHKLKELATCRLRCDIQSTDQHYMSQENAGDSSVKVNPLTLVKWIDTSPGLLYIREAADKLQAQYNSESKEIVFRTPNRGIVSSKNKDNWFKEILWPSGKNLRGKTCASQEFDQSCSRNSALMAVSTAWDAVSTYPIIQVGTSAYLGVMASPFAIGASLFIMIASNWSGQNSCNRTRGKKIGARGALVIFAALSIGKTILAGVGMEILSNKTGITKEYAGTLASEQVAKSQRQLYQLRKLENPKYLEYKQSCDALKNQLAPLGRANPLFTTLYVRAYGEYREQKAMQSLTTKEKLIKYGDSISNVPGDCNKQRIQAEIDGAAGDQLSLLLDKWRVEKESLPNLEFLSKNFPKVYNDEFKTESGQNEVMIRDGGQMIGAAWTQFFDKLFDSSRIFQLGFSLFWTSVSVILSAGAVFGLWRISKDEDMKMSFSNEMQLDKDKFLEAYSDTLDQYQKRRRAMSTQLNGTPGESR